jgi:hypothetical protein
LPGFIAAVLDFAIDDEFKVKIDRGHRAVAEDTSSDNTVTQVLPGSRNRAAEILYIRVSPDCPAAQDCLQYVPIVNGRLL